MSRIYDRPTPARFQLPATTLEEHTDAPNRKIEYTDVDGGVRKTEYVRDGDGWRETGSNTLADVEISAGEPGPPPAGP